MHGAAATEQRLSSEKMEKKWGRGSPGKQGEEALLLILLLRALLGLLVLLIALGLCSLGRGGL